MNLTTVEYNPVACVIVSIKNVYDPRDKAKSLEITLKKARYPCLIHYRCTLFFVNIHFLLFVDLFSIFRLLHQHSLAQNKIEMKGNIRMGNTMTKEGLILMIQVEFMNLSNRLR